MRLFESGAFDVGFAIAADLDFYLSKLLGGKVKITSINWPVIVFNTRRSLKQPGSTLEGERCYRKETFYVG